MISDNATEIITFPIEIITVSASDDERAGSGDDTHALTVAQVSEESGDKGDEEPDKGQPEKGKPRNGDSVVDMTRPQILRMKQSNSHRSGVS